MFVKLLNNESNKKRGHLDRRPLAQVKGVFGRYIKREFSKTVPRFSKRRLIVFVWTDGNGGFRKL